MDGRYFLKNSHYYRIITPAKNLFFARINKKVVSLHYPQLLLNWGNVFYIKRL